MNSPKWRKTTSFLLLCGVFAISPVFIHSQDASEVTRRVLNRRAPKYPEIARKMGITGNVKIEAVVAPNGTVKSTAVRGGHPMLAEAAQNAVRDWKWEPAAHETRELVEFKFDPQ